MKRACLISFLAILITTFANAADLVVIKTTIVRNGLNLGERVDINREVDLGPDEDVALIQQNGHIFRIAGPYIGRIADYPGLAGDLSSEGKSDNLSAISSLLSRKDELISTLGSSRATESQTARHNSYDAWHPLLSEAGNLCLRSQDPTVRRKNISKEIIATLISADFQIERFVWAEGKGSLRLNAPMLTPDTEFSLLLDDRAGEFKLMVAPGNLENVADEIAWLASVDCLEQALETLDNLAAGNE